MRFKPDTIEEDGILKEVYIKIDIDISKLDSGQLEGLEYNGIKARYVYDSDKNELKVFLIESIKIDAHQLNTVLVFNTRECKVDEYTFEYLKYNEFGYSYLVYKKIGEVKIPEEQIDKLYVMGLLYGDDLDILDKLYDKYAFIEI